MCCLKEAALCLTAVREQWDMKETDIENSEDAEEEELIYEAYTDKLLLFILVSTN